jgi:DNA-binding CsgD family transcriptional regulator
VEGAVRSGDRQQAEVALERLSERAGASATPTALGHLARSEALLARDEHAEELYQEAVAQLDRSPALPDRARARLLYGEWLVAVGRLDDARGHLRAAHELFDGMNAEFFAQRTARALAEAGEQIHRRAPDRERELTAQELQVAERAAEGASNREIAAELFISASTVDYHLRKIYRKLEITSRRKLRTELHV